MRWLFNPGSRQDDAPQLVTLEDDSEQDSGNAAEPVEFLPGGGLRVDVSNAAEARTALLALQRRQRDLVAAATSTAGGGAATVGGTLLDGVTGTGRRARDLSDKVVRRVQFKSRAKSTTSFVGDSLDLVFVSAELADAAVGSIKLIGVAAQAIAEAVPEIDLSDFDFLDILNF
jgi:hypothetical protein